MPQKNLVKTGYLRPEETLPLIIRPAEADVNLAGWAKDNLELIEAQLIKHGAILFRGFDVGAVPEFEEFALSLPAVVQRERRAPAQGDQR